MDQEDDLDILFRRLHLANSRRNWSVIIERAECCEWSYRDFLGTLLREEIAHRAQTRIQRLTRRAGFPFLKTIEEFDFSVQSSLRLQLLGSALAPEFSAAGASIIFVGQPGRGKTHLAVAIAYRAILNGFEPLFVTAAELIDDLSRAFRTSNFQQRLQHYVAPALLVVDEVGYLTCAEDAANVLFHVVNERHRRRKAMIFTTNKPLQQWGEVLHDPDLAEAILDRILERGRIIVLDGPSMRTRHLSNTPQKAKEKGARISGIQGPEFPEHTGAERFIGDNMLSQTRSPTA